MVFIATDGLHPFLPARGRPKLSENPREVKLNGRIRRPGGRRRVIFVTADDEDPMLDALREFLRLQSAGGIVLIAAAAAALLLDNSPLSPVYAILLETPVEIRVGALHIAKPLLLWVNDGLMAIFFLLVGLEIKREMLEGELSTLAQAMLPALAAIGGMTAPAAIYAALNWGDPVRIHGWAIPAATDIAFALGVLALLGNRVPVSLKVFLTAVAIFDDLGAIVIIAMFYTANLSLEALATAGVAIAALVVLNRAGVTQLAPFILVGVVLWVCVLKSGVHATLAGVALALAIPLRARDADGRAPLLRLEHMLHPWVAFAIVPIFAFANAGVSLGGLSRALFDPVTLGIIAGLFVGKQLGIFGTVWLAVRSGLASAPAGTGWLQIYGVSLLAGIGFTMSLFIGTLAFDDSRYASAVRLGVLSGSLLSALCGYLVLRLASDAAADGAPRSSSADR